MNPDYLSDFKKFYDYTSEYKRIMDKYNSKEEIIVKAEPQAEDEEWEDEEDEDQEVEASQANETTGVPKTKAQLKQLIKRQFVKNSIGELLLHDGRILGTKTYLAYYNQTFTNYAFQRAFYIKALESHNIINPETDLMLYNNLNGLKKIYNLTVWKIEAKLKKDVKQQSRQIQKMDQFYQKKLLFVRTRKDRMHNYVLNKHFKERNQVY